MRIYSLIFCFLATGCLAQPSTIRKVAEETSTANLKKNLYYLASEEFGGRLMGSHGDTLAAKFVAAEFARHGLIAPFGESYFQPVPATQIIKTSSITVGGTQYTSAADFSIDAETSLSYDSVNVILADFNTYDQWWENISSMELKNSAVILNSALGSDINRLDSLEEKLKSRGAVAVIFGGPLATASIKRKQQRSFLPEYVLSPEFTSFPIIAEIALAPELLQSILSPDQVTSTADGRYQKPGDKPFYTLTSKITLTHQRELVQVTAPNVIGVIKGTDENASCIILSAHHDHDGKNGNIIYPGAVDNASGVAAIVEVAALMNAAAKQGVRPRRTIVFASYTGEERGLLGSFYFAAHPLFPIKQTHAVLNIDMLGRIDTLHADGRNPDSNYAYILVKDDLNRGLRKSLLTANESVKLTLDTHYELPQFERRRIQGSDQYPFYLKGVPFVRIDCGFAKEYHKPEDTPDKINYELLTRQTKLVFLTLWNLANN